MKLSGTSGLVAIIGALIIVYAVVSHLLKKGLITVGGYQHPNVIIGIVGAVVLVIGLYLGSRAKK